MHHHNAHGPEHNMAEAPGAPPQVHLAPAASALAPRAAARRL